MELYAAVRRAVMVDGLSHREAARRFLAQRMALWAPRLVVGSWRGLVRLSAADMALSGGSGRFERVRRTDL